MGCGASSSNPPLTETKMQLIRDIPADLLRQCQQTFNALDKDGNGSITLEDSIWAKPFLDAHDIDGDGRVSLNEYLYACSRQIANDPEWSPTVAILSDAAFRTKGRYLILGMKGSGKTTLLEHLKIGSVDASEDGMVRSVVYGQTELFSWDLPGRRGDLGYDDEMAGIDGIMLVVDATDEARFNRVQELMQKLLVSPQFTDQAKKVKLMVLANKQDLGDAVPASEVAQALGLKSIKTQWSIQNASAKQGDGVFEAFAWLTA